MTTISSRVLAWVQAVGRIGLSVGGQVNENVAPYLPATVKRPLEVVLDRGDQLVDTFSATDLTTPASLAVMRRLGIPAVNHLVLRRCVGVAERVYGSHHQTILDLAVTRGDFPRMDDLYQKALHQQWIASERLDWSQTVDPHDPGRVLIPEELMPLSGDPRFDYLNANDKKDMAFHFLVWMLSQFYYGEQGARIIANHLATAVPWESARQMAQTQAIDEARHVEVFGRYLREKTPGPFEIDPNLMVILEVLINSAEWDIKFLGMQIMIEGLAVGSFATLRSVTGEPLLKSLLTYVIQDEARHVHFGLSALEKIYKNELTERERNERKELASQLAYLMYQRFLGDDFRQMFFPEIPRRAWNRIMRDSKMMRLYRQRVFSRIVNDLVKIGLIDMTSRGQVERRYEKLGLLELVDGRSTDTLSEQDLLQ